MGGRGHVVLPDLFGLSFGPSSPLGGLGYGYGALASLRAGPLSFGITRSEGTGTSGARQEVEAQSLGFSPSVDVFVTNHLSLGGRGHVDYVRAKTSTLTGAAGAAGAAGNAATSGGVESRGYSLGLWPRVGYLLPLGGSLALWPRLSLGIDVARQAYDAAGRALSRRLGAEADLGLVVGITDILFADVGPTLMATRTTSEGDGAYAFLGRSAITEVAGGARASLSLRF